MFAKTIRIISYRTQTGAANCSAVCRSAIILQSKNEQKRSERAKERNGKSSTRAFNFTASKTPHAFNGKLCTDPPKGFRKAAA